MAAASWTPNSVVHINDGTAEYDMSFINLDQNASAYRYYVQAGEQTDLSFRHQKLPVRPGFRQLDRHSVVFNWSIDPLTGVLPILYQANVSFLTPTGNPEPTRAIQMMNALPALLNISGVRTQLLNWRV